MVPVALGCAWAGGAWWCALLALGAVLMLREWFTLCRGKPWPWQAAGLVYVGVPVLALAWLRLAGPFGRGNLLGLLLAVWASDIGAYAAGRLLGGRKLAPSISPGKTWSGAGGGLAAAMIVGAGAALWYQGLYGGRPLHGAAVAALLSVAAQAGDLLESGIKRHLGVKDSGTLIPGHGGVLDRVDALMTAAPVAAVLGWICGQGVSIWH